MTGTVSIAFPAGLFTPRTTGKSERRRRRRAWQFLANAFRISNDVAKGLADQFTTKLDAGTAAVINIYDGTQATDPDTAIGAQVLLAQLTMSATSFGAATDANPGGLITANAITGDASANATGTASWFRMLTQSAGTAIADGSVGTSGCDLNLNTVSITAGSTVDITAFTVTMPES